MQSHNLKINPEISFVTVWRVCDFDVVMLAVQNDQQKIISQQDPNVGDERKNPKSLLLCENMAQSLSEQHELAK